MGYERAQCGAWPGLSDSPTACVIGIIKPSSNGQEIMNRYFRASSPDNVRVFMAEEGRQPLPTRQLP